jgi:hypothetical protein
MPSLVFLCRVAQFMTVVLLPPALIAVGAALLFSVIAILDRMDMADDSQSRAKRKQWRKRFWQMLLFLLFLMYAQSLPLPLLFLQSLTGAYHPVLLFCAATRPSAAKCCRSSCAARSVRTLFSWRPSLCSRLNIPLCLCRRGVVPVE